LNSRHRDFQSRGRARAGHLLGRDPWGRAGKRVGMFRGPADAVALAESKAWAHPGSRVQLLAENLLDLRASIRLRAGCPHRRARRTMGAEPMLRFEVPPDKVFLAILHAALALQQGYVEELMETEEGPASRWWPVTEPMIARFFDPPTAVRLIERLLAASRDTQLYQLTDYHWLMIYRCLETFCDLHNDEAANDPSGAGRGRPLFHRVN